MCKLYYYELPYLPRSLFRGRDNAHSREPYNDNNNNNNLQQQPEQQLRRWQLFDNGVKSFRDLTRVTPKNNRPINSHDNTIIIIHIISHGRDNNSYRTIYYYCYNYVH